MLAGSATCAAPLIFNSTYVYLTATRQADIKTWVCGWPNSLDAYPCISHQVCPDSALDSGPSDHLILTEVRTYIARAASAFASLAFSGCALSFDLFTPSIRNHHASNLRHSPRCHSRGRHHYRRRCACFSSVN